MFVHDPLLCSPSPLQVNNGSSGQSGIAADRAGSLKGTCKPGGPSLEVRAGASNSWHSPGVWSLR